MASWDAGCGWPYRVSRVVFDLKILQMEEEFPNLGWWWGTPWGLTSPRMWSGKTTRNTPHNPDVYRPDPGVYRSDLKASVNRDHRRWR